MEKWATAADVEGEERQRGMSVQAKANSVVTSLKHCSGFQVQFPHCFDF